MSKFICIVFTLCTVSTYASPFDDLRDFFVQKYCLKSQGTYYVSSACAYYFAFSKDFFKRDKVKNPNAKSLAQEELWRDALTAQRLIMLRAQMDYFTAKYKSKKKLDELPSYDDCFNLDSRYGIKNRNSKFPCLKLVSELMKETRKSE